jgi:hypothetical protein
MMEPLRKGARQPAGKKKAWEIGGEDDGREERRRVKSKKNAYAVTGAALSRHETDSQSGFIRTMCKISRI